MVDIETLGTDPGAAILSIGAVTFDETGILDEFYRTIDLESCQKAGLEIDANTLKWWMRQDESVRDVLLDGDPLRGVLNDFKAFYPEDAEVWANSPSFDCAMLEVAFETVGLTEPWSFKDTRDVRTLRSLPCSVDVTMEGDEHDALDDARYQARVVSKTLQSL